VLITILFVTYSIGWIQRRPSENKWQVSRPGNTPAVSGSYYRVPVLVPAVRNHLIQLPGFSQGCNIPSHLPRETAWSTDALFFFLVMNV